MKVSICVLTVIAMLTLWSCSGGKQQENVASYSWDCSQVEMADSFDVATYMPHRLLLPLEETAESRIAHVDKLILSDSVLYLLDARVAKRCYCFSILSGKFLFTFGEVGRANNEYLDINDISVDSKSGHIHALCNKNCIFVYDAHGVFIQRRDIPFVANNMEYEDGQYLFVCDDIDKGGLLVTDDEFKVKRSYFPNEDDHLHHYMLHPFQKRGDGTTSYIRYMDNKVYHISQDGEMDVLYDINFGSTSLDRETANAMDEMSLDKYIKNGRGWLKYFSENDKYAWVVFFDQKKPCVSLFDKQSGESHTYSCEVVKDSKQIRFPILLEYQIGGWMADVCYDKSFKLDKTSNSSDGQNPTLCLSK